ncbi:MAG: ThuA domain-containing protein [Rubripirellula sp.]|nr:ThuA domain-containing protein [Rubripirellula sp.]
MLTFLITFSGTFISDSSAEESRAPRIVFLCAEKEYSTDVTLPRFAKEHLSDEKVEFIFAKENERNALSSHLPIDRADLLIISVRRRALPVEQLTAIKQYVATGKPVIGIRTANHAFALRNEQPPVGHVVWGDFDQVVFGGNYTNHHPNDLIVTINPSAPETNLTPLLLEGVLPLEEATSRGSLYKVSPINQKANVLLTGEVVGHPAEPIAWTFVRDDGGRSFYTSLGHPADFDSDVLPRLLLNAIDWCLGRFES